MARRERQYSRSQVAAEAGGLPWAALREDCPVAPEAAALLQTAQSRTPGLARQVWRRSTLLRLAAGFSLVLLIVLGWGGYRLAFNAPGLGTIGGNGEGAAWASADGYIVYCTVYDEPQAADGQAQSWPHAAALAAEVEAWARRHKLPYYDDSHPLSGEQNWPQRCVALTSGGGPQHPVDFMGLSLTYYSLYLYGAEEAEFDALKARLSALPGVDVSHGESFTEYFQCSSPQERWQGRRVLVNGRALAFPQDFTRREAYRLKWYFLNFKPELLRYAAFRPLGGNQAQPDDRLGLGDVYTVAIDADGNLVLTTFQQEWAAGRALRQTPRGSGMISDWCVDIVKDAPEPGFDPLAALSDLYKRSLEDYLASLQTAYPRTASLNYILLPPERLLRPSRERYSAEEVAQARQVAQALDAALTRLQAGRKEYWNRYTHQPLMRFQIIESDAAPLRFWVRIWDAADGKRVQAVRDALASVPGAPEPEVDDQTWTDPSLAVDASADSAIHHSSGPARHSTAWACAEGYVLECMVFDELSRERYATAPLTNYKGLSSAVKDWAGQTGMPYVTQSGSPVPGTGEPELARYVLLRDSSTCGGGLPAAINNSTIILAGATSEERDALLAMATAQPGVLVLKSSAYDLYQCAELPQELLYGCCVSINGKLYDYPVDFTPGEAAALGWYINDWPGEGARYNAFIPLGAVLNEPDSGLELGDVYKVEKAADGALAITTVVECWDEGRKLREGPQTHPNGSGGWSVEVPPDCPEPRPDPLAMLAGRITLFADLTAHPELQQRFAYYLGLRYPLLPLDKVFTPGAPKFSRAELDNARALAAQLDAALSSWRRTQPGCWNAQQHCWALHGYTFPSADTPLWYYTTLSMPDASLKPELLAALAAVPGAPAPEVTEETRKQQP